MENNNNYFASDFKEIKISKHLDEILQKKLQEITNYYPLTQKDIDDYIKKLKGK